MQFFEDFIETDLVDTHRLILIDLLGHGATEGAELHYRFSAKEQVADLAFYTPSLPKTSHFVWIQYGSTTCALISNSTS